MPGFKEKVWEIIVGLTQTQHDKLYGLVQVNVDREDMADDIEEATKSFKPGDKLYQIKVYDEIFLFVAQSEQGVFDILNQIRAVY